MLNESLNINNKKRLSDVIHDILKEEKTISVKKLLVKLNDYNIFINETILDKILSKWDRDKNYNKWLDYYSYQKRVDYKLKNKKPKLGKHRKKLIDKEKITKTRYNYNNTRNNTTTISNNTDIIDVNNSDIDWVILEEKDIDIGVKVLYHKYGNGVINEVIPGSFTVLFNSSGKRIIFNTNGVIKNKSFKIPKEYVKKDLFQNKNYKLLYLKDLKIGHKYYHLKRGKIEISNVIYSYNENSFKIKIVYIVRRPYKSFNISSDYFLTKKLIYKEYYDIEEEIKKIDIPYYSEIIKTTFPIFYDFLKENDLLEKWILSLKYCGTYDYDSTVHNKHYKLSDIKRVLKETKYRESIISNSIKWGCSERKFRIEPKYWYGVDKKFKKYYLKNIKTPNKDINSDESKLKSYESNDWVILEEKDIDLGVKVLYHKYGNGVIDDVHHSHIYDIKL
jgi:hypothetical protein